MISVRPHEKDGRFEENDVYRRADHRCVEGGRVGLEDRRPRPAARLSEAAIYNWKSKYGSVEVSDARRLKELESENAKLKRSLADAMLDQTALKDPLAKSSDARSQARSYRSSPDPSWDERKAGVPCRRC